MNKATLKKIVIEAYMAGANSMYCGCYERQTREDARNWHDEYMGIDEIEDCECCEDE